MTIGTLAMLLLMYSGIGVALVSALFFIVVTMVIIQRKADREQIERYFKEVNSFPVLIVQLFSLVGTTNFFRKTTSTALVQEILYIGILVTASASFFSSRL